MGKLFKKKKPTTTQQPGQMGGGFEGIRGIDGSLPKGYWNPSRSKDNDMWSVGKQPSDASHSVYNLRLIPLKTKQVIKHVQAIRQSTSNKKVYTEQI